jgi:PTH1 family peptidyl-tRNA hydrolase
MKLVVGLGNPGPKYEGTRHNIGFAVVDYLAAGPGVSRWRSRFEGLVAEAVEGTEQVLLLKPDTFMNLSGRSVRAAADFYKVPVTDLLVVCDDIALPLGKLRVRAKGSHGGQNGLRNIQEHLGTQDYPRLRVGVGNPGEYQDAADYVLSRFSSSDRKAVEEAVALAGQAVLTWVRRGIDVCMNQVNGEAKPERPKKDKPKKDKTEPGSSEGKKAEEPGAEKPRE